MVPRIEFVYSYVYDNIWTKIKEKDKIPIKIIKRYVKDVEKNFYIVFIKRFILNYLTEKG